LRETNWISVAVLSLLTAACGPRAHMPPRPNTAGFTAPGALAPDDSAAVLARALAPVLYLQRDESFPLSRAVAVVHPTRRVIGYHLLWRDDVHGAWVPFTKPTDRETAWVGYDSTGAPTDVWTYWHGVILHTDWRGKGTVGVDVQWGKHGSLPRGVIESDLPAPRTLNAFYAVSVLGLVDIWLGNVSRKGPWCFCHGYPRYREYSRPVILGQQLDAVARTENPRAVLDAVFGKGQYAKKENWP
jgi:hypothetical protein